MKNNILLSMISLMVILLSCKKETASTHAENATKEHQVHWSYEGETGPEHWPEIEKNSDCDGQYQSPINIITKDVKTDTLLTALDIHYAAETKIHDVVNNGHSIQYNFEKGDYILYHKDTFNLKQIHFHEAAEHTINGIRYPMEIHMVHQNANNEFAVLGIMVQEGESSKPFDFLEQYLPVQQGETKAIDTSFDLNLNFPQNKNYYYYKGSLTTPPCTEGVNWFVFAEPITISVEQVLKLQQLMPINNYRNERPLNGRIVSASAL